MGSDIDLLLRMEARARQRALPAATHARVALQPEALILAPIAMAGEDGLLHAFAWHGPRDHGWAWCVDPRRPAWHHDLLTRLQRLLIWQEPGAPGFPQLIVPSKAAVALIERLSELLRISREPGLRELEHRLTWFAERVHVPGQQTLVAASGLLAAHYRTGMAEGEEEHLGALLAWFGDPARVRERVAEAERIPMGVHPDPRFDDELSRLLRLRAGGVGVEEEIGRRLRSVTSPMIAAVLAAVVRFGAAALPPLPGLAALQQIEAEAWDRYRQLLDRGGHIPVHDSLRASVFRLELREEARAAFEAAVLLGDGYERARGRLDGRLLAVEVEAVERLGRSRLLVLRARQPRVLARERDRLVRADQPVFAIRVLRVERDDAGSRLSCAVVAGQRLVGLPGVGDRFELVDRTPDWGFADDLRTKIARRMRTRSWLLGSAPFPGDSSDDRDAQGTRS